VTLVTISCAIAEQWRTFSAGTSGKSSVRRADEQTVIFGARFIPKSLYPTDAYCIAFRK
jgi:hypothetical protein